MLRSRYTTFFLLIVLCTGVLSLAWTAADLQAQSLDDAEVYGVSFDASSSGASGTSLAKVNPLTGEMLIADPVEDLWGVVLGSSTFDHDNHRYIIWGADMDGGTSLHVIDANTGELVSNEPADSEGLPLGIQYDLQNDILYGLKIVIYGETYGAFVLTALDPYTNTMEDIGEVDGLQAVAAASSCFDSDNGVFFVHGVDEEENSRLYAIDVSTAEIISDPIIEDNIHGLQFSVQQGRMFSFLFDMDASIGTSAGNGFFAEVDVETAEVTPLLELPEVDGVQMGSFTYEQASDTYLFLANHLGPDIYTSGPTHLYAIDAVAESLLAAEEITGSFIELEADNTDFARSHYGKQETGFTDADHDGLSENEFDLTASFNVFNGVLTITADAPLKDIALTDLSGRWSKYYDLKGEQSWQVYVPALPGSVYVLEARTLDGRRTLLKFGI